MKATPARRDVRMVDGQVEIDGLHWRYSVSDNLEASTWALNLHGYMAGGGVYWRESTRLAARLGLRVVNPNLPGFGGSEPLPWERVRMTSFADGLAALLDHLGAPAALVLGHSMGGAVALQFAHDYPERTLGVIYRDGVSTASWKRRHSVLTRIWEPVLPDVGMALDLLAAFATDLPDLAVSRITSMVATAAPDLRLNARSLSGTLPVGAMLLACDYTSIAEEVAAAGAVPILPMWGRYDRIVPPATGREFASIVGEDVWWVLGGHSWMIPRPATQLDVLRYTSRGERFLDRVDERARVLTRLSA
jgi:pimeloyl-ACP methyl ester carboxylesterase